MLRTHRCQLRRPESTSYHLELPRSHRFIAMCFIQKVMRNTATFDIFALWPAALAIITSFSWTRVHFLISAEASLDGIHNVPLPQSLSRHFPPMSDPILRLHDLELFASQSSLLVFQNLQPQASASFGSLATLCQSMASITNMRAFRQSVDSAKREQQTGCPESGPWGQQTVGRNKENVF